MQCSYCKNGINNGRPLGCPMPQGQLASIVENNVDPQVTTAENHTGNEAAMEAMTLTDPLLELSDVMDTDFTNDFNLSDELWEYT